MDIEETEAQLPEQVKRMRLVETIAPLLRYLDEELGFAECLTPEFNQFFDEDEKPTLTYLITYRFSFNKLSFWWIVRWSLIIPTIIITFAMTILGATGVFINDTNNGVIEAAINNNIATSIFEMIKYLTASDVFRTILYIVTIIAVVLFFVTSSDSGSLVVDNLTSGGKQDSPKTQRVFWAVMEGVIALAVLLLGGKAALITIQSAVIITGFPFEYCYLL
jgi:hypothetical protein